MEKALYLKNKKYISAKRAAEITGYSNDYIGQLCRGKKIDATLVGRSWYVCEEDLLHHKDTHLSPYAKKPKKITSKKKFSKKTSKRTGFTSKKISPNIILEEEIAQEKNVVFSKPIETSRMETVSVAKVDLPKTGVVYVRDDAPLFPELKRNFDPISTKAVLLKTVEDKVSKPQISATYFDKFIKVSSALIVTTILVVVASHLNFANLSNFVSNAGKNISSSYSPFTETLSQNLPDAPKVNIDNTKLVASASDSFSWGKLSNWAKDTAQKMIAPWLLEKKTPNVIVQNADTGLPRVALAPQSGSSIYYRSTYVAGVDREYVDMKIDELKQYFLTSPYAPNVNRYYISKQNDVIVDRISRTSGSGSTVSVSSFDDLTDTLFTGVAYGDVVMYNGSAWVNVATSSLGIAAGNPFGQTFEVNTLGYLAPTTTITTLLNGGFVAQASSTIVGDAAITGNLRLSGLSQGFAYIGSTGKVGSIASSSINLSWFNNDAGFVTLAGAFPFTSQVGYNSTSTTLGLLNGFFSTASSTISGTLNLPSVALNSLLSTDASGAVVATSAPTFGYFNATSTAATSTIAGGLAIEGTGFVYDYSSNNVGIGTAAPVQKLTVVGNIALNDNNTQIQEAGSNAIRIQTDSGYIDIGAMNSTYAHIYTDRSAFYTDKGMYVGAANNLLNTSSGDSFIAANGGNVGIGTNSPSAKLHVAGNIYSSGTISGSSLVGNTFNAVAANNTGFSAGSTEAAGALNAYMFRQNIGGDTTYGMNYATVLSNDAYYNGTNWIRRNQYSEPMILTLGGDGSATGVFRIMYGGFGGASDETFTPTEYFRVNRSGYVGIGTTTPTNKLTIADTAASQITLSAGAGISQWAFRNAGGKFYISTTTVAGTATSSVPALYIDTNGSVGIGTSTIASRKLEVVGSVWAGRANNGTSVEALALGQNLNWDYPVVTASTSDDGGWNKVNWLSSRYGHETSWERGSADGTQRIAKLGGDDTNQYFQIYDSTTGAVNVSLSSDSSSYINGGNLGVGTSTPWGLLSVNANGLAAGTPQFVVGSSTATNFIVANNGNVGIGSTTPYTKLGVVNSTNELIFNDNGYGMNGSANYLTVKAGSGVNGQAGVNLRIDSTNLWQLVTDNNASSQNAFFIQNSNSSSNRYFTVTGAGLVGISTTTPQYLLNLVNANTPQLSLGVGAGIAQWTFRNAGGNFYLSTTTVAGTATTSIAALEISNSGFGTTTVRGLNISGQATSTSNVGFNITTGCYAVNGTCVSGGHYGASPALSLPISPSKNPPYA